MDAFEYLLDLSFDVPTRSRSMEAERQLLLRAANELHELSRACHRPSGHRLTQLAA